MKRTATHPANVGAKSVQPEVRLRGKPCSLKRHFKGCLRQIIGYLDLLASRDPERFVWCSPESIQRHARKWKTGSTYNRWQIFFWLREAKKLGVLTSAIRTRHGIQRKGFVVASHESLVVGVIPDNPGCVLHFKPHSDEGQTTLENSQTTLENGQTTLQTTLNSRSGHTLSHTADHTEESEQIAEIESDSPNTDEVLDETLDEERRGLALLTLSSQPLEQSPEEKNPVEIENEIAEEPAKTKTPTPPRTSSFDDLTKPKTQPRGQGKADRTIGDEISLEYAVGAEIIEAVSDGEFDTDSLANYPSTDDLVESCTEAHNEMSNQPFLGRKSYAAVMGKAMQILRAKHGVDAPRGWLPVMKQLRASAGYSETGHDTKSDRSEANPSEILTHHLSPFGFWSEDAGRFESERQNNPQLSDVMVDTAKRLGFPRGWSGGLQYADAVIAELQRQNQPVPTTLEAIS